MYEPHELFEQPAAAATVWRFVDFTKFVQMLDSQTLFFARADKLGDPFEGSLPKPNIAARAAMLGLFEGAIDDAKRTEFANQLAGLVKSMCVCSAVSCWHLGEHESAAMWKLYLSTNHGVAIRTTYARLRDSLVDTERVFVGRVNYVDYETDQIGHNLLEPLITKRKSFEHEHEVRAIVWKPADKSPAFHNGIAVKVDLSVMVGNVYVAPTAPGWFLDVVRAVIGKFGYTFEVKRSRLDDEPLY